MEGVCQMRWCVSGWEDGEREGRQGRGGECGCGCGCAWLCGRCDRCSCAWLPVRRNTNILTPGVPGTKNPLPSRQRHNHLPHDLTRLSSTSWQRQVEFNVEWLPQVGAGEIQQRLFLINRRALRTDHSKGPEPEDSTCARSVRVLCPHVWCQVYRSTSPLGAESVKNIVRDSAEFRSTPTKDHLSDTFVNESRATTSFALLAPKSYVTKPTSRLEPCAALPPITTVIRFCTRLSANTVSPQSVTNHVATHVISHTKLTPSEYTSDLQVQRAMSQQVHRLPASDENERVPTIHVLHQHISLFSYLLSSLSSLLSLLFSRVSLLFHICSFSLAISSLLFPSTLFSLFLFLFFCSFFFALFFAVLRSVFFSSLFIFF